MMDRRWLVSVLLLASLGSGGCAGVSKTAQGAGVGGALGAGVGALAGAGSGKSGKGALIGGAAGALLGGIVGNDIDQQDKAASRDRLEAAEARPKQAALGITDVQVLAAKGWSDEMIISHLRDTGSSFQLSTSDIDWLRANAVSDRVILAMKQMKPTGVTRVIERQGPTQVIYREAPPQVIYAQPVQPVYVVQPAPPPPSFGVGVRIR